VNNPSGAKTRAVVYVRVSTDKQAESGLSLEAQRARCIQYAALYDIDVVDIVADTQSAKDLERPGLNRVQEHLRNGTANAVLITDLDRLTRSVADGYALVQKWFSKTSDYVLLSVFDHVDTRSPEGRLTLTIKLGVSQYEREKTAQRTITALKEKRAQLAATGESLGPKPIEKLVPDVARLVLELKERGLSVRDISDDLNRQRVPTARGGKWHPNSVQRLLQRLKPEDESQNG
jgi:DNA invertase Pin-like site-specific DNA recombinase